MLYADRLRADEWAIFLFHGVTEEAHSFGIRNYTRKHIPTSDFAAIMRSLLAAGGAPMSMTAGANYSSPCSYTKEPGKDYGYKYWLPGREKERELGRRFSITFDDGFANVMNAVPILRELKIPATFYIATDWVERNIMSWIDRVEWAFERSDDKRLIDGRARVEALTGVRERLKGQRLVDLQSHATKIQEEVGAPETWSLDDAISKKLTWDQVKELAADPLFTIGGHTHTHATLPFLSEKESKSEIETCLGMLKDKAGVTTEHFSYPEGQEWSYSERTIEQLKAAGITVCPTAIDGTNLPRTDPFLLNRIMVT